MDGASNGRRSERIVTQARQPDADGSPVGLQLFDGGELHDGGADVLEALLCEGGAGDVLEVGGEVDAGVLLRVAVRGWIGWRRERTTSAGAWRLCEREGMRRSGDEGGIEWREWREGGRELLT